MESGAADIQQELLEEARRQTAALEALRNYAFVVLLAAVIGLVLWAIAFFGN